MKKIFLIAIIALAAIATQAQQRTSVALKHGAHRIGKRTDAEMERWRGHALGQFIHWGVYAIPGGEWDGKQYNGAAEWIRSWNGMPNDVYDNLYKQFDPKKLDAKKWAKQAREMGVKYMVFTTKHHDGFCLWPSAYTDYTIANSPYKKDIVGQVVDAYTAEGIDVHLYFSIIDWSHKGYRSAPAKTPEERAAYEEFKTFTRAQLIELLERYPSVRGLWFDGSWDKAWIEEAAWVDSLGYELRAMRPGLIIGSRFRADENGKRHYDTNGDLIDDYDQTWERALPDELGQTNGVDWDCCMTLPENQWGYQRDWRGHVKTPYELLEMLVKAVSLGGNLVVNFGPDEMGNIRPEESHAASEMGAWMKVNGDALYGAEPVAGVKKQGWGYYTMKDGKLYLTVFNRPIDNRIRIELPRGWDMPVSARLLDGKADTELYDAGRNKANDRLWQVVVPSDYRSDKPFVIELMFGGGKDTGEYDQAKI